MSIGVIATKCGMTRIFDTESGASIPVTVALVQPNRVVQLKTLEKDGYTAIQVTHGEVKQNRLTKASAGHFAKAKVVPGKDLMEFRADSTTCAGFDVGSEIKVDFFKVGQKVDVTGTTKGRGFSGVIRRHNFSSQRASHGNSLSHNAPGSIGQNQSPGRVFKGKKMCGHLGNAQRTVMSQQIVRVDSERNLILVKGAIPGAPGGEVFIRHAVKVQQKEVAK